jgi:colanic acid/amylovoran biosynthesis glycosyltransferase
MRIAYLTGQYPRATDTFIQREIAQLRALGVHVQPFSIRRPDGKEIVSAEQRAERDRTDYILPPGPVDVFLCHLVLLFVSPIRYCRSIMLMLKARGPGLKGLIYNAIYFLEAGVLARRMQREHLTHVHNHIGDSSGTVAMLAGELGGGTFSITLHGPGIFYQPYEWSLGEKISRALFVCCISYFCRSQAMMFSDQSQWDRLHIVHCGVVAEQYTHQDKPVGPCRLLFVGRLAAVKGLTILLDAITGLHQRGQEVSLTIVGDGPDRLALEDKSNALGLSQHIEFVGYKSQAEVSGYLLECDLFVLPSFAEGVPVVLMEAMAARCSVIATQVGGVSELVDDGVNGFLVPPGDVDTLSDRINQLAGDASLRDRFGAAGREKVVGQFNVETEGAWLHEILACRLAGKSCAVGKPADSEPMGHLLSAGQVDRFKEMQSASYHGDDVTV